MTLVGSNGYTYRARRVMMRAKAELQDEVSGDVQVDKPRL